MPKVLKTHTFKSPERGGAAQSKYDWKLILGGQIVQLDAGTDYDPVGTGKDGKEFDRTDAFTVAIKSRAYDEKKIARVDRIEKNGKVVGLIVQATPMTPEQITEREAALARRQEAAAAKKAAEGTNGAAQQAPLPEAVGGEAPE